MILIKLLITASSLNLRVNARNKNLFDGTNSVGHIQPKSTFNPIESSISVWFMD